MGMVESGSTRMPMNGLCLRAKSELSYGLRNAPAKLNQMKQQKKSPNQQPNSKTKSRRPSRSLRTILMMWLLMFSIVPLAFITGYSLVKYEQAIDQELGQRLHGNYREIQLIFEDLQRSLLSRNHAHATDKSIV